MNHQSKKIFPFSCSKQKLIEMYHHMPIRFIREEINEIIRENRGLSKEQAVHKHIVFAKELTEFREIHGLPKNYILEEDASN
jgi:hypothetical protein